MSASESADTGASLAKRRAQAMFDNDAASQALGMEIVEMAAGYAKVVMTVREDMVNGHGTCHGGIIFSLADSSFAFAYNSQNQSAVAASCTIDYLRPAFKADKLTAVAEVVHQGRRTGVCQVRVSNQDNKLLAIFKGNATRIDGTVIADT